MWLLFSCRGASSGGSLWGGYSLYLWHLGLLPSFHGSTLVVRVSSRVTSGVSSLFVAESLLSRRNVPEGTSLVLVGNPLQFCRAAPLLFTGGSFLVTAYGTCQVVVGDSGFLSSWER